MKKKKIIIIINKGEKKKKKKRITKNCNCPETAVRTKLGARVAETRWWREKWLYTRQQNHNKHSEKKGLARSAKTQIQN